MFGKTETIVAHLKAREVSESLLVAYWANAASVEFHTEKALAYLKETAATLGYDLVAKAEPEAENVQA